MLRMNYLVYLSFAAAFFSQWLASEISALPGFLKYGVEFMALITGVAVVLYAGIRKSFHLPKIYILVFFYFVFIIGIGLIVNQTPAKQIILGIRAYFKFIPFFLLPVVYPFSDDEIRRQLKFLLVLLLLQFPIAFYQRFVQYKGLPTGDVVTGSLMSSNVLSMALLCGLTYLFVAFLEKRIGKIKFAILALFLLAPTTINETKGTLVFLPLAFTIPLSLCHKISFRALIHFTGVLMLLVLVVAVVNKFNESVFKGKRHTVSVLQYFTDKNKFAEYMLGSKYPVEGGNVRRFRALMFAAEGISDSISSFGLGYGIGTVMDSKFKKPGEYEYYLTRGAEKMTSVQLLWETGVLGLIVYYLLFFLIIRDASGLLKYPDFKGYFGKSHFTVAIIVFMVSMLYFNILRVNVFVVVFWYFTGIVINKKYIKLSNSSL